ncbi:LOW QUALITY PROTEIN: hypothetical protein T552_04064 [Pneumocystis carinii B80]|uniref:Uncharacterized protein n=1 Tax=Pneumocystis carinii (strain B80) TaxID=1408658 RepID=A0A0W4ZQF0_PNEC8|nr:LOW QUALITY PROTEIN: hypothetical protein T552_04064 [Pneumocystis carinii B80]KTW30606.1 LOW QUALITY PROTEIN: hypothetical protein T552_04064 [Pneumocystis carinii B80]
MCAEDTVFLYEIYFEKKLNFLNNSLKITFTEDKKRQDLLIIELGSVKKIKKIQQKLLSFVILKSIIDIYLALSHFLDIFFLARIHIKNEDLREKSDLFCELE